MTQRGAPSDSNIAHAMNSASSNGFDYVLTGQPTRSARWNDNNHGSGCIYGLGSLGTQSTSSSSGVWPHLLDGNGNEGRSWPAASPPQWGGSLISLCQDASAIPNACVFDHRWRVGNFPNCISP